MYALLVLNKEEGRLNFIVRLREKQAKDRVSFLLESNKRREAFDLLKARAEVEIYLPPGTKLPMIPHVTLIEELL